MTKRRYYKRRKKHKATGTSSPQKRGYSIENGVVWFTDDYCGGFNLGRCSKCRQKFPSGFDVIMMMRKSDRKFAYFCRPCAIVSGWDGSFGLCP